MPSNYSPVDRFVSRSAQPKQEDFAWLKEHGVTDVFNFRTMYRPDVDFDEEKTVKELGMNYHNIPSITAEPTEENVELFLTEMEEVRQRGGKAHIHCKAGADRTGMYAFIYKMLHRIGTFDGNLEEWIARGLHYRSYPNLMDWAKNYVKRYK